MVKLPRKFGRTGKTVLDPSTVNVVSGLPRSGTTLMMRMLDAGGVPPLTDGLRVADADNPNGYYEYERVKALDKGDTAWLPEARGKAVKVIATLLQFLPRSEHYRLVFMQRDIEEILASQRRMMVHRGEPTGLVDDERMGRLLLQHREEVKAWLAGRPEFEICYVSYNGLLDHVERELHALDRLFLGLLDLSAMQNVIDPILYRQRRGAS